MGVSIILFVLLFFFGFFGLIVFAAINANRAMAMKRTALEHRMQGVMTQIQSLRRGLDSVDEKTKERVREATNAVELKLGQVPLIAKRGRDRDFARAHSILDQCDAKIANAQGGMERSQSRLAEKKEKAVLKAQEQEQKALLKAQATEERMVQKQAKLEAKQEAAQTARAEARAVQRTMGMGTTRPNSFGPLKAGLMYYRVGPKARGNLGSIGNIRPRKMPTGAFRTRTFTTSRSTNWQEIPAGERGVCFFCSRPCLLSELTPVTIRHNGMPRRVLACPDDVESLTYGHIPQVRVFFVHDHYVPWYAYDAYDPYVQYYPFGYDDRDAGESFYPIEQIPETYWEAPPDAADTNWGGDYVFTPDNEIYQDFYSQEAAGSAGSASPADMAGFDLPLAAGGGFGTSQNEPAPIPAWDVTEDNAPLGDEGFVSDDNDVLYDAGLDQS